jgi:hypothetical protein
MDLMGITKIGDPLPSIGMAGGRLGNGLHVKAKRTNEFRAPRKGEWYLSGAIPIAYKAPNDLSTEFRIMRLVVTRTVEIETEVPVG